MQFQFWDLKVSDHGFEIGLSFNDIAEKLVVPFSSVRGFYDPSVNFELEFDAPAIVEVTEPVTLETKPVEAPPLVALEKPADGSAQVVSLDSFRQKK